jgi:stage II sporulation protein R
MKKILLPTISILLSALIAMLIPTEAEGAIYGDTVRLHILASSDSAEDQALKLTVRDRILEKYGKALSLSKTKEDAKTYAEELLPEIEKDTELYLAQLGKPCDISARLEYEWFDTRIYENFTLPCGYYCSLTVAIGEGKGKNWWCVMYPPLCLDACISDATDRYTNEERRLISP